MTILESIRELADDLGLAHFSVQNQKGEILENAIAIIGLSTEEEIGLHIENTKAELGIDSRPMVFKESQDGQSMIILGDEDSIMPNLIGNATKGDDLSFYYNDELYFIGIYFSEL